MDSVRIVLIASWSSASLVMRFTPAYSLRCRILLEVPAELVAHCGKQLVREVGVATRREPLVQRRRQHIGRYAFVDGCLDRPAAFPGIGYVPGELRQVTVLDQR